ncbi:hypothetical protein OHC33_000992 [Knufia fluminis]|uniref:Uncharacterized protein n=1 Tax=Knufia fluminis TaxID=191047 RepID=A0AAN8ESC1_9EURO|nr:hypothetical protein OHC33_000992 [Knufia fluminis]
MHHPVLKTRLGGAIIAHTRQSRNIHRPQLPLLHHQIQLPKLGSHRAPNRFPLINKPVRQPSKHFTPNPHESETLSLAHQLLRTNITIGTRAYSHPFKNYGRLPLRYSGPYYEFPLLEHGRFFDGAAERKPGVKRIVFTGRGEFAGVIVHDRGVRHGFRRVA